MAFITYEDYLKVAELTRLALMFYVFQNKVKWSLSIIKLNNAKQYILRYTLNILRWQPDRAGKYTNDEAKHLILQKE